MAEELYHHGVKGMKWGVRKDRSGASRSTVRAARKDAKESARAKMFYGEGAGTRRKLIKAKVESRSKSDPAYKREYEKALAGQNLGKHASAAKRERKAKNAASGTARTTRGVKNLFLRNGAPVTTSALLIFGAGSVALGNPKVRSVLKTQGGVAMSSVKRAMSDQKFKRQMRNVGLM